MNSPDKSSQDDDDDEYRQTLRIILWVFLIFILIIF